MSRGLRKNLPPCFYQRADHAKPKCFYSVKKGLNRDHSLSGNHVGERECHIAPDWILIYRVNNEELYLVRTGTHADLLNM
ncbi:MAG: type II toxin-antitoxin system YafQ family toxin [Lachnospiraceae bacterium]